METQLREDFLSSVGWRGSKVTPLAGDASTRSYFRVEKECARAILMSAPPAAETASCPPLATTEERKALGYNASARLAGPNLSAFVAISKTLCDIGVSAPEVCEYDLATGMALIEDLGDDLYASVVSRVNESTLYEHAIDVQLLLHEANPKPPADEAYQMLDYDALALQSEADLFIEWYWRLKKGVAATPTVVEEFRDAVGRTLSVLAAPQVIVLRDYHAENLLWVPERSGIQRVGVIDFQDGLVGSSAYDLVSLLEDARRDVDDDLASAMKERYITHANARTDFDSEQFMRDYEILALQRNAKILGVFARLSERDGKRRYLDFLPRVEAHFRKDMARPAAAPLQSFMQAHFPEFVA